MKKYEVVAIVLSILVIISTISTPLYTVVLSRLYGTTMVSSLSIHQHGIVTLQRLVRLLVNIAVAVWLAVQAKRDRCSAPIWCLFGLLFSVVGAILYFVLREQTARAAWVRRQRQAANQPLPLRNMRAAISADE